MALTAIGTHASDKVDRAAVTLTVDGRRLEIDHETAADKTAAELEAELAAAASLSDVALPTVTVHVNRDGSLAMATGKLDKKFTWPEDEREEEREPTVDG